MALEELKNAKLVVGTKQTLRALSKDSVLQVYIAGDADQRVIFPLQEMCSSKGVATVTVASKAVLGKACGIDVGTASVALLK